MGVVYVKNLAFKYVLISIGQKFASHTSISKKLMSAECRWLWRGTGFAAFTADLTLGDRDCKANGAVCPGWSLLGEVNVLTTSTIL